MLQYLFFGLFEEAPSSWSVNRVTDECYMIIWKRSERKRLLSNPGSIATFALRNKGSEKTDDRTEIRTIEFRNSRQKLHRQAKRLCLYVCVPPLMSEVNFRGKFSHPHRTAGKIICNVINIY
jgi:hypothetical protein